MGKTKQFMKFLVTETKIMSKLELLVLVRLVKNEELKIVEGNMKSMILLVI